MPKNVRSIVYQRPLSSSAALDNNERWTTMRGGLGRSFAEGILNIQRGVFNTTRPNWENLLLFCIISPSDEIRTVHAVVSALFIVLTRKKNVGLKPLLLSFLFKNKRGFLFFSFVIWHGRKEEAAVHGCKVLYDYRIISLKRKENPLIDCCHAKMATYIFQKLLLKIWFTIKPPRYFENFLYWAIKICEIPSCYRSNREDWKRCEWKKDEIIGLAMDQVPHLFGPHARSPRAKTFEIFYGENWDLHPITMCVVH